MKIVNSKSEVREALTDRALVGFVPTMGALHSGHVSLVRASRDRGLFTVASIFVNPTQFNNSSDLDAYPIDIEGDLKQLEEAGCDLVFIPTKDEIYEGKVDDERYLHDFGHLETLYEGKFRPGHFKGVGQVVHLLFEIVEPQVAFFGEKDFQQLQIIRSLVKRCNMDIEIVGMPTVREEDGLAMSSRNRRLTKAQRQKADLLFKALTYASERLDVETTSDISIGVSRMFEIDPEFQLEYFSIIDPESFETVGDNVVPAHPRGIISAYLGEVRLIDNMQLA